uniref:Kinesin motor domain-containing protein n=1 Tax=Macrostomum lignano TaxID=282301 RepID=A0A1I8FDD0_9PLAT
HRISQDNSSSSSSQSSYHSDSFTSLAELTPVRVRWSAFPPRQIIRMHLNSVGSPELASIVEYLVSIAPSEVSMSTETGSNRRTHRGLAFLADFRACSQSIFRIVIDALDSVQSRSPGSVAVFYALMPKSKELAKSLQKMLGLYQKKTLLPTRKVGTRSECQVFSERIV